MTGLGIIGIGGWGKNHVRVASTLKAMGYLDFVGISDISEERLRFYSKLYHVDYQTRDINELFKLDKIDAVIISTPTHLHYNHASMAIENNLHVLVEKPLTANSSEARDLINMAHEKKLILMVGFLLRYSEAINYLKEIISNKKIGKLISISAKRTSLWPKRSIDVGVIKDLAVHDIDLVRYLTNYTPSKVLAFGGRKIHDYEDHASMLVEYTNKEKDESQLPALIEASWITPFKIRRLEITGDKGTASVDLLEHKIQLYLEDQVYTPVLESKEPLFEEVKNFILSIQNIEKPLVTGLDGLIALKVCEAAQESIERKKAIKVDF